MNNAQQVASSVTTNTNIIQQIFATPTTIVNLLAMAVTITLFLINIFVIRKNNKIEFQRKVNLNYYEVTVLNAMKEIFKVVSSIKKEYLLLKSNYDPSIGSEKLLLLTQTHLSVIDDCIENIEANSLIYISVFSKDAGDSITKSITDFYDECTNVFSKYSTATLTPRNMSQLTLKIEQEINALVKETYQICKTQSP